MKVYLQYPWKVSDSQYYKSLLDNPPEGIEYLSQKTDVGTITNKRKLNFLNFVKRCARTPLEKSKIPLLNKKKTESEDYYGLIHCAHCLSSNNTPWVADFEAMWQMWLSGRDTNIGKMKALKVLQDFNCKKILAWTDTTKKEIIKTFPEIKEKVTVVPYGMVSPKFKKVKSKKIRLLFIGRYFKEKGGLHALQAMDWLTKTYDNVEALFISEVPKKILEEYTGNKNIKFKKLLPYKDVLEKVYPRTDILIYPGYSDTFGFAFVEALAFGIPIVTVEGYARKDIITEGKTGYIIKRKKAREWYPDSEEGLEIVTQIINKATILIEDKKSMEKMSKNCIKEVKTGKFSIENRNKKLLGVYNEAGNI